MEQSPSAVPTSPLSSQQIPTIYRLKNVYYYALKGSYCSLFLLARIAIQID